MRNRFLLLICAALLTALPVSGWSGVPQLINYQGILTETDGDPVTTPVNVVFALWNHPTIGDSLWSELQPVTPDTLGRFSILLGSWWPIPDSVFAGSDVYLSVKVGDDSEMIPRQRIVSVAYAYRVGTVDSASGGTITGKLSVGQGHTNTGEDAFVAGRDNIVSGDYSSVGGGRFNEAVWEGASIGGGYDNIASNIYATVAGGAFDSAGNAGATVAGGCNNVARGVYSSVGGGQFNGAVDSYATVGGGRYDTASGSHATVSGGLENIAEGEYAAVPGGSSNLASGRSSFAAGRRAKAVHAGAFVWADATETDLVSARENHFLVRASGGVEITGATGNTSVMLPDSAISAPEILDEPGVAGTAGGGPIVLDGTTQTILSQTISAPVNGFVVVTGSAQAELNHTHTVTSRALFGVSMLAGSFGANQDLALQLPDTAPGGSYSLPVSVHGTHPVTAGPTTFYFLAKEESGDLSVDSATLTLLFFPTEYVVTAPSTTDH